MDLFRVVTATGDITKETAIQSAKEFLEHAFSDFSKFENTEFDLKIKKYLENLSSQFFKLSFPSHRLRWTESILTNRCRLF